MREPLKLGKYEIHSVLGKGAMGVVYKAFDPQIERMVAIKTVRKDRVDPDLAAQFLDRFKNEARAAGRLQHPNIVSVYEYGEDEKVAFIAMEFVEGVGLRAHLDRKTPFELPHIVTIVSQLLLALDLAHSRGVVHRDIKPANLILTPAGQLKVADFGIARIDTTSLTQTGMVMGTPSYMSPEQCQGLATDHRSDLFSAGVILYELLTGERPFTGSAEMIAYRICNEPPLPPSQVAPRPLQPAIDGLIMTALAKAPDARFQNALAFNAALASAAGGAPAAVIPVSEVTRINLASGGHPPMAPATWDEATLATLERELARHVGPVAKVLVRKASTQAHDIGELYMILANHIGDPDERSRFVNIAPAIESALRTSGNTPRASSSHGSTGSRTPSTSSTGSGASQSRPALATQPLEARFIEHTTQKLAVYLGPIAKVVARKAAEQAHTRVEFIDIVAGHIGTQDRRAFMREIGEDPT